MGLLSAIKRGLQPRQLGLPFTLIKPDNVKPAVAVAILRVL